MKVALYGNICNNMYGLAKALKKKSKFEVCVFIDEGSHLQMSPESEDPELAMGYPNWIKLGDYTNAQTLTIPFLSPLVKEFNKFDLVIVSGDGPLYAQFSKTPFVFFVTGGDLTVTPFPWVFRRSYKTCVQKLASFIIGFWQRRAMSKVLSFWAQPFSPYTLTFERLKIHSTKRVVTKFPLSIDTDKFSPSTQIESPADPQWLAKRSEFDFVVFHPSRLMIKNSSELIASGQWKQNDELIRGFADFCRRHPAAKPLLALIDRDASPDREIAKALIQELNIENHVYWIKPPQASGLTRNELIYFYKDCDIVADDFGAGWFGGVVLEGLSLEKPTLCYIDELAMKQMYPWHPIISVRTKSEISDKLTDLYKNPELRLNLGRKGRQWVLDFHSPDKIADSFAEQVQNLEPQLFDYRKNL